MVLSGGESVEARGKVEVVGEERRGRIKEGEAERLAAGLDVG